MSWNSFAVIVGAPFIFLTLLAKAFRACRRLDDEMPSSWVKAAGRMLASEANTSSVITFFLAYFDRFFGSTDHRRPRFLRCARFSLLLFTALASLLIAISAVVAPQLLERLYSDFFLSSDDWLFPRTPFQNAWITLTVVISVNVVGDYFSLWETRYILMKLQSATSSRSILALWIADILASLLIFVASLLLAGTILGLSILADRSYWINFWLFPIELILDPSIWLFAYRELSIVFSLSLYTTLTTTFWAGISIFVVKFWCILRLAAVFPIAQKKPFGAVTMMVVAVFVVGVAATALLAVAKTRWNLL